MPPGAVPENPHLSDNASRRDRIAGDTLTHTAVPWSLLHPPACLPGTQRGLCAQALGGPSPHTHAGLYQARVGTVLGGNSLLEPACCCFYDRGH